MNKAAAWLHPVFHVGLQLSTEREGQCIEESGCVSQVPCMSGGKSVGGQPTYHTLDWQRLGVHHEGAIEGEDSQELRG